MTIHDRTRLTDLLLIWKKIGSTYLFSVFGDTSFFQEFRDGFVRFVMDFTYFVKVIYFFEERF